MTLRENAQFIDELRQHYRRLDGLLVKARDRITSGELCDEVNVCVIAIRRLLFGGIGDPNHTSFADGSVGPPRPNDATALSGAPCPRTRANAVTKKPAPATGQSLSRGSYVDASKTPSDPPSPEEIEERKLGAATAASPVKLEVVR